MINSITSVFCLSPVWTDHARLGVIFPWHHSLALASVANLCLFTLNTFQMYKVMYVLMCVAPSNVDGHWERCPCDNLSWHSLTFSIVAAFAQCAYIVYCASNVDGHWESYPCDAPLTLASVSLTHPALDSNVLFKQKTKLQNATILQIPMPYIQCVSERAVVSITYSLEPEILESSNLFHLRRGEC